MLSRRAFLTVGGVDIAEVTATTTYDRQRLEFTANVREQRRTMDARRDK